GEFPNIDTIKEATGASFVINIDHHKTSSYYGDINWVVPEKAATGELIFEFLEFCKIPLDSNIALPLFVALSTDTGRFTFPNTTPQTFAIASKLMEYIKDLSDIYRNLYCNRTLKELKLQAECIERLRIEKDGKIALVSLPKEVFEKAQFYPEDFQEYIDLIKSMKGVEVALLLREENGKVRVSIRTNGLVDAAQLAEKFGGGGHMRASGCTLSESLDSAVNKFLTILNGIAI
ncbi:MAG: DHH family phosphoesterase, partial [Planctomycetota bacterium]